MCSIRASVPTAIAPGKICEIIEIQICHQCLCIECDLRTDKFEQVTPQIQESNAAATMVYGDANCQSTLAKQASCCLEEEFSTSFQPQAVFNPFGRQCMALAYPDLRRDSDTYTLDAGVHEDIASSFYHDACEQYEDETASFWLQDSAGLLQVRRESSSWAAFLNDHEDNFDNSSRFCLGKTPSEPVMPSALKRPCIR